MNTQTQLNNLNTEKIAVYATIFGVLFIIIGALLLFTPKIITSIMSGNIIETSIGYDIIAIAILTTGGLLNMLSFRLNTSDR